MEGLPSTSLKVVFTKIRSKARPAAPIARKVADFRHQRNRIIDESGRLGEYQGDGFETDLVSSNYPRGARARAERGASRGAAE